MHAGVLTFDGNTKVKEKVTYMNRFINVTLHMYVYQEIKEDKQQKDIMESLLVELAKDFH